MQLPEDFIRQTREVMGDERFERYIASFGDEPPVSIRINPLKASTEGERVPWCKEGYYLPARPNFTFDPLLHAGCYYVQEAASMFVSHVLSHILDTLCPPVEPIAMLDLCAAPGGKSTAVRSILPAGSLLVSNEPMRQRAQILLENMEKWGAPDCIVTNAYPKDFRRSGTMFDIILCDVPCSGEGMFRKDPATIGEWSLQKVGKCWRLQREIVSDAWAGLRPGGWLIYSTCTLNTQENEENVKHFKEALGAEVIPVPVASEWNITGSLLEGFDAPVYRFIPGISRGEGLFMALLRKPADAPLLYSDTSGNRGMNISNAKPSIERLRKTITAKIHTLWDGNAPQPISKGKDKIPVHAQALYTGAQGEQYPKTEITYTQAISYLRREAIILPPETPRGFVIVTFRGVPLGFVKNIGNRANNHYPEMWKIKTTHIPDEYEAILRHP